MHSFLKRLVLFAVLMLTAACQSSEQKEGAPKNAQKNQSDDLSDANATPEKTSGVADDSTSVNLADLFHDEIDVKTSDFDYFTACGDIFSSTAYMKKQIVPWPSKLKKLMLAELNKMPIRKKIGEAVIGYYLVKAGNLDNAAGVMCGTKGKNRGVIFMDEDAMNDQSDASKMHLSSDFTIRSLPVPFPVWTVVHETMHAIDHHNYSDPETGLFSSEREKVSTMAWTDFTDSKYNGIGILALTDLPRERLKRTCILSRKPNKAVAGLNLLGSTPEEDASDLQYMEEKTNFITPYAMTNTFEDFADTNTAYYIGTRKGWPVWKTYSYNVTQSELDESKVVHEYDARTVIKSSKNHRRKMCALAGLVFSENCEDKLP